MTILEYDAARSTAVRVAFSGFDAPEDITNDIISLNYTDNEEDKADDLQIKICDRELSILKSWPKRKVNPVSNDSDFSVGDVVNFTGNQHYTSSNGDTGYRTHPCRAKITRIYNGKHPYHLRCVDEDGNFKSGAVYGWVDADTIKSLDGESSSQTESTITSSSGGEIKVGDTVTFKGGSVYRASTDSRAAANRGESECRVTIANSNTHPYHLISNDGKGVYGWVDAENVVGGSSSSAQKQKVEINAAIIRKNWNGDGRDEILDCGVFEVNDLNSTDYPSQVDIKATSVAPTSTICNQKRSKAWENIRLSGIAKEIAGKHGFSAMYESDYNPLYERREQIEESDIVFLQGLCKDAGISLKVTAKMLVLFDASAYEQKESVFEVVRGSDGVKGSFSWTNNDTSYSKCHVSYTNPDTGTTIEYTYTPRNSNGNGQVLEINEKVNSREEARQLAMKRLRQKNKSAISGSVSMPGNVAAVAGVTCEVSGWGLFDGKFIIESATHNVSKNGYTTTIKIRSCLEEY